MFYLQLKHIKKSPQQQPLLRTFTENGSGNMRIFLSGSQEKYHRSKNEFSSRYSREGSLLLDKQQSDHFRYEIEAGVSDSAHS